MVQETFLIGHLLQGVAYWNSGRFLEGGLLEGDACWKETLVGIVGAYWKGRLLHGCLLE